MNPNPVVEYQTDHDLLVTLNERVKNLIEHVASVVKTNETLTNDHEDRIRNLEVDNSAIKSSARTWRYILATAISVVGLALTIITAIYH